MKICVIGAGAIGGWIAGLLADAGNDVSLLTRGTTLAALRTNGLIVRRKQDEKVYRLKASGNAAELDRPEAIIITTKGQNIPAIAPVVTQLLGADTFVVPAINGIPWWFFQPTDIPLSGYALSSVDPAGETARAIAPERVIGCVVHASAWSSAPGVVDVQGEDKLIFGEPDGERSLRCAKLAAAFADARPQIVVSENIRRDIWLKLWGNMSMNPLSVLTGCTTARMLSDPDLRGLVREMMIEMQTIGAKIGLPIPMSPEDRMAITLKLGDIKTSMLRDFEAGRELEIAPILGALVEIARRTDESAPFLHAIYGMLRLRAAC